MITGGSRGLGLQIAEQYLRSGAAGICICGRDEDALQAAEEQLIGLAREDQTVISAVADVSSESDVQRLVATTLERFPKLQILVNNAGIYGPKGSIETVDWGEWKRAIEVNLYGSVLPARALTPHFKRSRYGKIIQLSGGGATNPLPGLSSYAASKAAAVRLAETLAEELRAHRVDVNAIAPGALNTRMLDEVLDAGPERVGQAFHTRALEQQRSGGTPLTRGASLAVWLGSAASDGITGKLLSAVWDPWERLARYRDELGSDVYTLRRIVPTDRGMDWD